jgi:exonuclease III
MNALIEAGELCKMPAWWTMEAGIRAFLPLKPGEYEQSTSKVYEVFKRAIALIAAAFMLPLTLLGLVVGITLHFIGYKCVAKTDYLYHKSLCPEAPLQNRLKVLTLNACFMPGGLPLIYGGVTPSAARIDALAQRILQADPDLICLEEMHSIGDSFALMKKLEGNYTHFYFNIGPQVIFFDSGLFVASKQEIQNPEFTPFSTVVNVHNMANKGIFHFELSGAHIFHTHLFPSSDADARPSQEEKEIRRQELKVITDKIEKLPDQTAPILVVGDFNIAKERAEHAEQEAFASFVDTAPRAKTWRNFGPTVDAPEEPEILDYSLLWKASRITSFITRLFPTYKAAHPDRSLSDNEGLISDIAW